MDFVWGWWCWLWGCFLSGFWGRVLRVGSLIVLFLWLLFLYLLLFNLRFYRIVCNWYYVGKYKGSLTLFRTLILCVKVNFTKRQFCLLTCLFWALLGVWYLFFCFWNYGKRIRKMSWIALKIYVFMGFFITNWRVINSFGTSFWWQGKLLLLWLVLCITRMKELSFLWLSLLYFWWCWLLRNHSHI